MVCGFEIRMLQHAARTRVPLIKFVGKRNLVPTASASSHLKLSSPVAVIPTTTTTKLYPSSSTAVDFFNLTDKAFYGRPKIGAAELEGTDSGGATYI
jgi:hypothetical protein